MLAHPLAEMDKGAGIAMCCTFGDLTDVTWWRELAAAGPHRRSAATAGCTRETPEWLPSERRRGGVRGAQGQDRVLARARRWSRMLRESGDLDGEPKPTQRMANFYEKGDKPLEIVATRQWYIRNGGRDADAARRDARRGAPRSPGCPPT